MFGRMTRQELADAALALDRMRRKDPGNCEIMWELENLLARVNSLNATRQSGKIEVQKIEI